MNEVNTVKDLIATLQQCDPDGKVKLSLDAALLYDDEKQGTVEYSFAPLVDLLYSQQHTSRCDRVYFRLSEDDISRVTANRHEKEADSKPYTTPCATSGSMVAIAVNLSREIYVSLLALVDDCNQTEKDSVGATTHGKLDVCRLISMLLEDAAMAHSRPGSWEGAEMQKILTSHGY